MRSGEVFVTVIFSACVVVGTSLRIALALCLKTEEEKKYKQIIFVCLIKITMSVILCLCE